LISPNFQRSLLITIVGLRSAPRELFCPSLSPLLSALARVLLCNREYLCSAEVNILFCIWLLYHLVATGTLTVFSFCYFWYQRYQIAITDYWTTIPLACSCQINFCV